jgi:hypothetical protein
MQATLDLALPEIEELPQGREFREEIIFLPDEILQQVRVIRHVVEDIGRRQPIALKLATEIGIDEIGFDHEFLRLDWSVSDRRAPLPLRKS